MKLTLATVEGIRDACRSNLRGHCKGNTDPWQEKVELALCNALIEAWKALDPFAYRATYAEKTWEKEKGKKKLEDDVEIYINVGPCRRAREVLPKDWRY